MARYWITGGTFASTDFNRLAPGAEDFRIGPFVTYEEAECAWAELSWQHIDECNTRFVISESG